METKKSYNIDVAMNFGKKFALLGKHERAIIEKIYENEEEIKANYVEMGKMLDIHPANVRRACIKLQSNGIININKNGSNKVKSLSLTYNWVEKVIEMEIEEK